MRITARDMTRTLRELFPAPVSLATRTGLDGTFRVRVPDRVGQDLQTEFMEGCLSRRLGEDVEIRLVRKIRRRDYGWDRELAVSPKPRSS